MRIRFYDIAKSLFCQGGTLHTGVEKSEKTLKKRLTKGRQRWYNDKAVPKAAEAERSEPEKNLKKVENKG